VAAVAKSDLDRKFVFFDHQIGRRNPFILRAKDKSLLTNNNIRA
jgi:hypothetical protein